MIQNLMFLNLLLVITFSACTLGNINYLPPEITLVPGTDLVQQIATIAADPLPNPTEPATPNPIHVSSSLQDISTTQKRYLSSVMGIQFSYPDTWYLQEITESQPAAVILTSFDPANPPHKLEWTDQTVSLQFRLLPAGSVPQNLDAWVESAKEGSAAAYLSIFEEELFLVANQPAFRLTLVSGSGGIIHQVLTILDGRNYEINIEGSLDLGKSVLSTLRAFSPSGLKPSEGDSPAAGICMEPIDEVVVIELGLDQSGMPLAGRCMILLPTQRIKLINQSDGPIAIQFADYYFDLTVGTVILLDKPVGEYLASGVHYLPMGPALWLKAAGVIVTPLATMPGPLSYYSNPEVGDTLTIPPGWNVDEYGLAMPNKEVIFYPNNAEPILAYLSISLDPRTLDQIIDLYAQSIPHAAREDTIFNDLPAVKYTYPYDRHEYYIPNGDQIILIVTDKPMDGDVQLMLMSISFTPTSVTHYTSYELGYSLDYQTGWLVDENGLTALSKEVLICSVNAEPFVRYLDIGLDPLSLGTLKVQDVPIAQKADIFCAGMAGVQYLYSSGRSEIYLDYYGQIYHLITDKATDEAVQDMIDSFDFIDS